MGMDLGETGDVVAAAVLLNEIGPSQSNGENSSESKTCANCGATLQGKYCHACGQSGHIHRSLLHMFEEVLHGLFHFDTKAWRTIPALIFRPGKLTKEYIEGKRTSYVSPLALFLFLIFLMFFVFSFTAKEMEGDILKTTNTREEIVQEIANLNAAIGKIEANQADSKDQSESSFQQQIETYEKQSELRALQDKLDKIDGKPKTLAQYQQELSTAEERLAKLKQEKDELKKKIEDSPGDHISNVIKQEQLVGFAENDVKYFKKKISKLKKESNDKENSEDTSPSNKSVASTSTSATNVSIESEIEGVTDSPWLKNMVSHIESNKELMLYKMKKNASSYAFLLMPISLPFLWLLFMFRRQYVMFDHAVLSL
jgi:CHASE3 domain sensor protein